MATLNLSKMKHMSEANLRKFASLIISLSSQVTDIENKCIKPYVNGELYPRDSYVSYNGYIYQATATNQDSAFDETHWDKLSDDFNELTVADIEAMLGLSQEQLETMANLIADTEVRLDKTYSSSKIYTDIQQCLNDSKSYTLKEIAKLSGSSYKVVTSTSEMTSESIIYLLANATNYDMYIVEEDGATTKIGNMDVNLDNYFTKTEIEADYLKKVDADGKYATIATVDGKVDKSSIATSIGNTSTDGEVPSAKAVYNTTSKFLKTYTSIEQLGLTSGNETIENIVNSMENYTRLIAIIERPNKSIYPNNYGTLIVEKLNIYRVHFKFCVDELPTVFVGTYHAASGFNGWQRVCTTTVEDVPVTSINLTNDIMLDQDCKYQVKNGICYVQFNSGTYNLREAVNRLQIAINMPLPACGCVSHTYVPWASWDAGKQVILFVEGNGELLIHAPAGVNGCSAFTSFSYPVAE